ncbi:hypothetical protein [Mariniplasma anaerobium]|uniref:Uncharacterized protein n=1 Tax=Mariniplasma anaerobium TaxID=2735436 RepID=A0A7U9XV06_9MOLU|nr:hypothetical protein [Mariniplasma anaerobium]BCR35215.1 hypothetical protein MPAN_001080 [Mariniplasma anaerobium]
MKKLLLFVLLKLIGFLTFCQRKLEYAATNITLDGNVVCNQKSEDVARCIKHVGLDKKIEFTVMLLVILVFFS